MFKTQYYIFVFCFLIPILSAAQVSHLDSIRNKYVQEKNDSLKIKYHLKYILALINDGLQSDAATEIVSAKKELQNFPVTSLMAVLFYYEGALNYDRADYLQSIISYEHSLKTYQSSAENNNYKLNAGNLYISLGLSYSMINDWENAQLNYQKAINETEKDKDSSGTALTYLDMAYIFSDVNDWINASVNLERSTNYLNINSDKYYQVAIYSSLAEAYSRLDRINDAKVYLRKSDSIIRMFPDIGGKTFYFIAKSEMALSVKNYSEALTA